MAFITPFLGTGATSRKQGQRATPADSCPGANFSYQTLARTERVATSSERRAESSTHIVMGVPAGSTMWKFRPCKPTWPPSPSLSMATSTASFLPGTSTTSGPQPLPMPEPPPTPPPGPDLLPAPAPPRSPPPPGFAGAAVATAGKRRQSHAFVALMIWNVMEAKAASHTTVSSLCGLPAPARLPNWMHRWWRTISPPASDHIPWKRKSWQPASHLVASQTATIGSRHSCKPSTAARAPKGVKSVPYPAGSDRKRWLSSSRNTALNDSPRTLRALRRQRWDAGFRSQMVELTSAPMRSYQTWEHNRGPASATLTHTVMTEPNGSTMRNCRPCPMSWPIADSTAACLPGASMVVAALPLHGETRQWLGRCRAKILKVHEANSSAPSSLPPATPLVSKGGDIPKRKQSCCRQD
mmetsp:Transcript_40998/g.131844  ORF Transcript_40998/g.131844 Transcript_40998/m.131844 type:complete len:411 (-) Transcript_40998:764-1996(-)